LGKLHSLKRMRALMQSRYPWAMLGGLLLAAAFPGIGVAGLAWIAPGVILLAAFAKPGRQAFRIGYVAGLTHYLVSLYWLLLIPVPLAWAWAKALGWLALAAFLALFTGTWVWLCWKIYPARLPDAELEGGLKEWPGRFLAAPWAARAGWCVACAAIWVGLEMTLARILGGFPWNLLGDSQYEMTPLIQIAAYTGVYGVSFLAMWASLSLIGAGMVIVRRAGMQSAWVGEIIMPMAAVSALYLAGYEKLLRPDPGSPELTIALMQPSIPQTIIWDEARTERSFDDLLALSEQALTNKPDLLIWPESAVMEMLRYDEPTYRAVTGLARAHKVWMIIDSDDGDATATETNYFNSSFLISPEGRLAGQYKKEHLVMFGEYVPFAKWLPFLKWLTPITGGYTPGEHQTPFELGDLNVKVSVLICFEDVFPQVARKYVDDDTDFLVNLTNDGWFGKGAAQRQHAAAALFRTVENGLPLVRCTNTGLTCWIDKYGRLRREFQSAGDGIYGAGYMIVRVPLLDPGQKRARTFYNQHGDWFGWACLGFAVLRIGRATLRGRKNETAGQPSETGKD
jgi:apolipoprotein N-acyltransferase